MEPKPNIPEDNSSPSREKTRNLAQEQRDNECFLPPLPSVEQMRMDVANATCELQQAFFHQKPNPEHKLDRHKVCPLSSIINQFLIKVVSGNPNRKAWRYHNGRKEGQQKIRAGED